MNRNLVFSGLMSLVLLGGCTWVHVTSDGVKVRVVEASEVAACTRLGETTVSLKADLVAGIQRNKSKVEGELQTLGRNSAAEMGGDAIVPASEIENGEQRFDVYRCAVTP